MIYHVNRRCALIRICCKIEPFLCYGQELSSKFCSQGLFVLVIYMLWQFHGCSCGSFIQALVHVCATKLASIPVECTFASLSCFIVLEII